MFQSFATWAELLDAIGAEITIYYQAPMDYQPSVVQTAIRRDGKIRVTPVYTDADPFNADAAHLSRFRRQVPNAR